jgi:hypothetical protein
VANQKILLKRSATQYKIPTTTQLQLGELGLNTYDGKLFIEKDVSGTASIVELGVGPTFQLTTGGSPVHTHSVSITGQQALDLLSGTATTITVRSSSGGTTAHTHDVTIEYDTTTKGFVLNTAGGITSNHTAAHTLVSNGGGVSSLAALSDVDTTGIANDKILKYNSTSSKWVMADDAEGTTIAALTDITDVNTGATNGQVLNWNNTTSKWTPVNQAGGHAYTEGTTTPSSPTTGDEYYNQTSDILYKYVNDGSSSAWIDISTDSVLSITNIDDISDVDTTTATPNSGEVLKWNGTNWVPAADIAGILQDIATATVGTSAVVLDTWNKSTYVSAKYQATCKVGSKYSVSELLVLSKGTSVEVTEYAALGDGMLTFTVAINGTNIELTGVSTDASTSVKLTKVLQGV